MGDQAQQLFEMHGGRKPEMTVPTGPVQPQQEKSITDKFDDELLTFGTQITSLSERFRDIGYMADIISELYDLRHRLVERKHELLRIYYKFDRKYKEGYAKRLEHYATGYDRKLTAAERERMAAGDMSGDKYNMDLLMNHINQIDAYFKTTVDMGFGVKSRIEVEDYLRKQ